MTRTTAARRWTLVDQKIEDWAVEEIQAIFDKLPEYVVPKVVNRLFEKVL